MHACDKALKLPLLKKKEAVVKTRKLVKKVAPIIYAQRTVRNLVKKLASIFYKLGELSELFSAHLLMSMVRKLAKKVAAVFYKPGEHGEKTG